MGWGGGVEMDVVDITETNCTGSSLSSKIKTEEDPDATEQSSSFDGTLSAREKNCSETSDADVESRFYGEGGMGIDSFENLFPVRKKKLTAHWKNFIRPLMWRSKWAELKINELQKRARKYDRELAAYEDKKKLVMVNEQQTSPDFGSKLTPFNSRRKTSLMMRRRRRRRVEDVTDIKSYFSKHNLFSYDENDKSNLDGSFFMAEEETNYPEKKVNVGGEGEVMNRNDDDDDDYCWLFPESEEDSNNPLEQFMRKILNAKSDVEKLKSELVSLISGVDNANSKLSSSSSYSSSSSSEKLGILIQYDAQTSSEDGLSDETNSRGGMILYGLEYDNMGMDRSEVSRYSNMVVPDIIESNVSKLSSVDIPMHQLPQSGDSNSEAIMDNGHIHSRLLEEKRSNNEEGEKESGQEQNSNSSGGGGAKCDINEEEEEGSASNTLLSKGKRCKRKAGTAAGWKNRLLL